MSTLINIITGVIAAIATFLKIKSKKLEQKDRDDIIRNEQSKAIIKKEEELEDLVEDVKESSEEKRKRLLEEIRKNIAK